MYDWNPTKKNLLFIKEVSLALHRRISLTRLSPQDLTAVSDAETF